MTATTVERLTRFKGMIPGKGTYPQAASTTLLKGTLVTGDASGNADVPTAGQDALGVAAATYKETTGVDGAQDVEVEYGVFGFAISGTVPKGLGEAMFVVDNQTVSLDSSGGTRGFAGFCSEVRNSLAYILINPVFNAAYADVAATASIAADGVAKADDLSVIEIPVPIGSFSLASGAAIPAFSNGVADGFELTGSKARSLRINDDSTTVFWASVKLPDDLDTGATVKVHFLASRVGSLDTTAAITCTAFLQDAGVAYDAGSDLSSGNTGAISGATKVSSDVSVTITGATAGCVLSVSAKATAALDDDDMVIHACWVSCTRDVG
jgi:hypothetical protein